MLSIIKFKYNVGKKAGKKVSRVEMFIKTHQGHPNRKGKLVDDETHDATVSLLQCKQYDSSVIFNC